MAMVPDAFYERFVLPAVRGGVVHIGAPLGARGLDLLLRTSPSPPLQAAIGEARFDLARTLLVEPAPPELDETALRLAVALHDLLFLLHPAAHAAGVTQSRLDEVAGFAATQGRLWPTSDADELVARHTMLHLLPRLQREDVSITFWAGRREFHGQEPPERLRRWPWLRQVHEERWRTSCFSEAAEHLHGAQALRALLDGSPLTDLFHAARIAPPLELDHIAQTLHDPAICRLVIYHLLGEGIERVGGALATAAIAVLDRRQAAPARFVLPFIAHLHLCHVLQANKRYRLTAERSGRSLSGDHRLHDFFALYAALWRSARDLAIPEDIARDSPLGRRCAEHAAACEGLCAKERTAELSALILQAVGQVELVRENAATAPTK